MPLAPLLTATDLHKTYRMGSQDLRVLRGVDFQIARGEWIAIVGASGSGKSTLLHILGALDRPTQGDVNYEGVSLFSQSRTTQDSYRNQHVGFVFQQYHLLPELNVLENVTISAMIGHGLLRWQGKKKAAKERAMRIIESLGMKDRVRHRPGKLSGGERQRVAIARALVNEPDVLLADEPTGNLDADTGRQILDVFRQLHTTGQAIVMVTHDDRVAQQADRQVRLESGKLKA
jgi:ABC-type lipoprotein export system ATPase subunit